MNILSIFGVAVSLSMDNLAVALAAGCGARNNLNKRIIYVVSAWFALAHFVMFSLGFLGGHELVRLLGRAGLWIACIILVGIGLQMVRESFHPDKEVATGVLNSHKLRMMLAFATSMDALFVGLGLGLAHAPYWLTVLAMVVCVFITSVIGFYVGNLLNKQVGPWIERLGGCVLIFLGIKLLL